MTFMESVYMYAILAWSGIVFLSIIYYGYKAMQELDEEDDK